MITKTTIALAQIQREIERVQKGDMFLSAMDWEAYTALKNALYAVKPLLTDEVVGMLDKLIATIDAQYEQATQHLLPEPEGE